jgi:predicted Rossmann fold flavoprotein
MKIAIIGAGASGLCAAIEAKRTDASVSVTLFEKNPRVGKKILVTGNGRCNITNTAADEFSYNKGENAVIIPVFNFCPYEKTLDFFKELGVYTYVEEGRVYPLSNQASTVLDALRFECDRLSVETVCDTEIRTVEKAGDGFLLNGSLAFDRVIIACGGKSSPVHGSDGSGAALLSSLGHTVTPLRPALVPLKCKSFPKNLKGVRQKCEVKIVSDGKAIASSFGEVQFTDYGLSGIPVMDISRFADFGVRKEYEIVLDCAPSLKIGEIIKYLKNKRELSASLTAENLLTGIMNKQLGLAILKLCGVSQNEKIAALSDGTLKIIAQTVKNTAFTAVSTKGFDNSQVTAGGVPLSEFNPSTLQSKKVKGLYACGEALDIDAKCGGFNLQWAWASGRFAGKNAAENKR